MDRHCAGNYDGHLGLSFFVGHLGHFPLSPCYCGLRRDGGWAAAVALRTLQKRYCPRRRRVTRPYAIDFPRGVAALNLGEGSLLSWEVGNCLRQERRCHGQASWVLCCSKSVEIIYRREVRCKGRGIVCARACAKCLLCGCCCWMILLHDRQLGEFLHRRAPSTIQEFGPHFELGGSGLSDQNGMD